MTTTYKIICAKTGKTLAEGLSLNEANRHVRIYRDCYYTFQN